MKGLRTLKGLVLLVLCLITVSVHFVDGDIQCKYNEYVVEDIIGKTSCVPCPNCTKGMGLFPQCGSFLRYGDHFECKPCIEGISYSSTNGIESCQPCGICSDHQKVLEKCNQTHNSKCAKGCESGFYLSPVSGDCQECSWCCPGSTKEKQCTKKGSSVPFYKQCKIGESIRCQPRCTDKQFVVVSKSLNKTCYNCHTCGRGKGLFPKCQSVILSKNELKCVDCIPGKNFSNRDDSSSCKPCTVCDVGKKIERTCNITHDTLCGDCKHGFYKEFNEENKKTCKQCSFCCGDKEDVIVTECEAQGMAKDMQCSYTLRSITKCRSKHNNLLLILIVSSAIFLIILILVLFGIWCIKKRNRIEYLRFQSTEDGNQMEYASVNRLPLRERPSKESKATNIEFRQSGIIVKCQDTKVGENLLREISVEICWDKHELLPERQGEIYLSPLIKLHPQGFKPGVPLKLDIPHSAFKQEKNNTWNIKIYRQTSEDEYNMKWMEVIDPDMEINPCSVKFSVTELGTFVVVGVPGDRKHAKKRMQCAVFGAEPRIGQTYTVNLYLFDDGESSSLKLHGDEEKEGRYILQKLYRSLYPDTDCNSQIGIEVDTVKDGWSDANLPKKVFYGSEWNESYKKIPMVQVSFDHIDPEIRDFSCTFRIKSYEKTAEITIFRYCEPENIENGVQPTDDTPNVTYTGYSFEEGQLSLSSLRPLSSLPNDVITKVCQSINDQEIDERRIKSVAVKVMKSITPDEIRFIQTSNEPFKNIFDMTKERNILLTIGELHSVLKEEGISSDVLLPYLTPDQV